MKVIFFGRGPVAQPAAELLPQQSWCTMVKTVSEPEFSNLPMADVGVVIDFGHVIPQTVLDHFPYGIVNMHPSLLPRWRGPSPIKSALLHGDTVTGVSIMRIDVGLDTGPLLAQRSVPIRETDTNVELEERLAKIGAEVLIEVLPNYVAGRVKPVSQSTEGITVSRLFRRQDGELSTGLTQRELWNRYRAFQPWPGVFFVQHGKRYKITQAHWEHDRFVCEEIQPEGKRSMVLAEFKRGYPAVSFADIV